jgi:hypothetical protein
MPAESEDTHGPIEEQYREKMKALAGAIDEILNDDPDNKTTGFALFMFSFGDDPAGRMNYISNAQRKDMVAAIKEFLVRDMAHQRHGRG